MTMMMMFHTLVVGQERSRYFTILLNIIIVVYTRSTYYLVSQNITVVSIHTSARVSQAE